MPCRFSGQHPGGKLRGIWSGGLQAHTQGEVEGDLARGVSRPTPKGDVEGDLARGRASRPTPRGVSRPTPGGSPVPHLGGGSPGHTQGVYPSMH